MRKILLGLILGMFMISLVSAGISYNAGSNLITLTGSGASPAGGTSWATAYDMDDVLAQCGAVVTKQGANAYDISARLHFTSGVYFVSESEFVELKPNPINPVYVFDIDAGAHVRFGKYDSDNDYSYNGAFWRFYFASVTGNRLDRNDGEWLIYGSNLWHDSTAFSKSWNFWGTTRIFDTTMEGTAYISGTDTNLQRVVWIGKGGAYDMLLASGYDFAWGNVKSVNSQKGLFMSSTVTSNIDVYGAVLVDNSPYDYYESGNRLMRLINSDFDRNKVYVPNTKQGLQECYTFNVKVTDNNGAEVSGATILLKDVDGIQVFSEDTNASGTLTNEQIVKVWWKGYDNASGIKDYNDHTLKVSKGADVTEYKITIDHQIKEDVILLPQATASYDNIMDAIQNTNPLSVSSVVSPFYSPEEEVVIYSTTIGRNGTLLNPTLNINVTYPNGTQLSAGISTQESTGRFKYDFNLSANTPSGTYPIKIDANYSSYETHEISSFYVNTKLNILFKKGAIIIKKIIG